MTQANQARWIGIEPTNPPQAIPIYNKAIADVYYETVTDLGSAGGNISIVGSTVPAGERWVIQHLLAYDTVSACAWIELRILKVGTTQRLRRLFAPGVSVEVTFSKDSILEAGYWLGA